jgi:membrane-bound serine protease (ClpP class)
VALGLAAIVLFLGRLALSVHRQPPVTGVDGLVGAVARASAPISPETPGRVDVHGEIWRAVSRQQVPAGTPVRVTGIDGLTLHVEPATEEGGTAWKG